MSFKHKKRFGQNFIRDINLLNAIVADAGVSSADYVLEIGVGEAGLTKALASAAKKVVAYEIDISLKPIIDNTLSGITNVEVVYKDILKAPHTEIANRFNGAPFKVVANLPYYITTPIIMYFLESEMPLTSLTIMVQKEVAERLVAVEGSKIYGSISARLAVESEAKITRQVSRKNFYPVPNVDSAVVRIDINKNKFNFVSAKAKETFFKLQRASFAMRRKTFANNIIKELDLKREHIEATLQKVNLPTNIRGEAISVAKLVEISNLL
ncbi:MAG: 16S rRNA (adenine(1518)-N(6)/adenine(1519)-N(6))-dimethyltransferase RsmA [Firmicutes bacterium]|nr:16S rRNA (adenine(1518)-N(6)/adenine(1519)-N(6))-dimethyltransferase RsmA [Bacillota bacterium]